jgi:hypothetical protein
MTSSLFAELLKHYPAGKTSNTQHPTSNEPVARQECLPHFTGSLPAGGRRLL